MFCDKKSVLLSFIFSCFLKKIFLSIIGYELPHDILCTSRSDDNRRAVGAVGLFSFRNSFYTSKIYRSLSARRRGIQCNLCLLWCLESKIIFVHFVLFVVPIQWSGCRFSHSQSISNNTHTVRRCPFWTISYPNDRSSDRTQCRSPKQVRRRFQNRHDGKNALARKCPK